MTKQEWIDLGYNDFVAEALEGRELSKIDVQAMTDYEVLDEVFKWHGIVNYTRCVMDAVDNVRNMEAIL